MCDLRQIQGGRRRTESRGGQAGVLDPDMDRGASLLLFPAQYEPRWNLDVKRFKSKKQFSDTRVVTSPAPHRATPVQDHQPLRNPVCDEGHPLDTHRGGRRMARPSKQTMALAPGTSLGHYDVSALIGEGGMGEELSPGRQFFDLVRSSRRSGCRQASGNVR